MDEAKGSAGVGVAAGYAAGWLAMTVVLLFVVCGALGLRWWAPPPTCAKSQGCPAECRFRSYVDPGNCRHGSGDC